jgi:photoactive yellow protein
MGAHAEENHMQGFGQTSVAGLNALDDEALDSLPYGVIGLDREGVVEVFNATESVLAGLPPARVIGAHFFGTIAQCMNNFMVAQRFEDEPELDVIIDFVLTLRMKPTAVKLRLLQSEAAGRRYLLIERNAAAAHV